MKKFEKRIKVFCRQIILLLNASIFIKIHQAILLMQLLQRNLAVVENTKFAKLIFWNALTRKWLKQFEKHIKIFYREIIRL